MELDSTEAIKSAVEVGLGVGFVSRWAISKEMDLGVLKSVSVDGIRAARHFTLISRTGPEPQGPAGAPCAHSSAGVRELRSNLTEKSI